MTQFVTLTATGLTTGAVIALVALGFLLIYKATGVVNFAQGDLVTVGAYVALWAINDEGWGYIPAYLFSIVVLFVIGLLLERFAYAPLRGRSVHVVVVSTLGAALVMRSIVTTWQGNSPLHVKSPFGFKVWTLAGARIPYQNILLVGVSVACVLALMLVFGRTQFGRQVRALASDRQAAQLQGIRVTRLSMFTFGLSAALAALAGVLVGPTMAVTPDLGFTPMLFGFVAAIVGGFGRLGGVLVSAFIVGLVQQYAGGYLDARFSDVYPFLLVLPFIAWRPQGLFGSESGVRV
ncbi:MAG: branched-chain amino acid transporter permease [Mycobacterium sp.]|jgi:branched-chain amino acid transport system permease protein|nr:branched-chain amino acid transporter permease [Mycobacterium sp.]